MEFKINRDYFYQAILDVGRAISSKSTQIILNGIKIEAKSDYLTLTGSNSDFFIEKTIPKVKNELLIYEVYQTGSIVIHAKYISEVIQKIPDDIYLKVNDNQSVTIQSEEIVTTLTGLDAEEYPLPQEINISNKMTIPSEDLIEMIKQTAFAASKSETRPVLTGVNFHFQDNLFSCSATDNQRLSLKSHPIQSNVTGSFVVPRISLLELIKLLGSIAPTEIDIFATKNSIMFKSKSLLLYSKLIEGEYPNTAGLLSKQARTRITLDTKQLLKGVERANIFASEKRNNNVRFQIVDKSKINISSQASEMGEIEETQQMKQISGEEELNISLDANFMIDALRAVKEKEISLYFNGSMRPILILPIGDDSHMQLISPVRSH